MKKTHARIRLPPLQQKLPPFQWTQVHQESFDRLKLALITAPVLAYLDYEKPFLLETNASLKGLGAILSQEDNDGNMHVISYASRALKPYEKSSVKLQLCKTRVACFKVVCVREIQGLSHWQ